jgi:hypothetical protein
VFSGPAKTCLGFLCSVCAPLGHTWGPKVLLNSTFCYKSVQYEVCKVFIFDVRLCIIKSFVSHLGFYADSTIAL